MRPISIVFLLVLFLASCQNEQTVEPAKCVESDISFNEEIEPILVTHCFRCHSASSNFGNVTLQGHDQVIKYVNNGKLLGSIKRDPGFVAMPINGDPLVQCDIDKIEAWIDQGALDN